MARNMQSANSAQNQVDQNLAIRRLVLAQFPRELIKTPTVAVGSTFVGTTTRIKLKNVGITTLIRLMVEIPVTIATANQTLSPWAPWNLIKRVTVTDVDGSIRTQASGIELYAINTFRKTQAYGRNNGYAQATQPAVINTPTAQASDTIRFFVDIPLAVDSSRDLRGSLLTQTSNGEYTVTVDWTSAGTSTTLSNTNDCNNYSTAASGTITVTGCNVTLWQDIYYPQPASNGQLLLPALDLATVYEISGGFQSMSLTAGAETLINAPNERTVIGTHVSFCNQGAAAFGTDFTGARMLVNGNTPWLDYGNGTHILDKTLEARDQLGTDLLPGQYVFNHRQQPVITNQYGSVQYGFTPAAFTAASNSFLRYAFESLYVRGGSLPTVATT
jgi:hypothetical protein